MTQDFRNISPDNPLVFTDFKDFVMKTTAFFGSALTGDMPKEVVPEQSEYNTKQVQSFLIARGHHVKSHNAVKKLMKEYKVGAIRRGREDWYRADQINKIPSRL